MSKPSFLIHYASPYYDPVEAHEYYMRTRELKGRRSGKLNEKGQSAKSYLKEKIDAERDQRLKDEATTRENRITQAQDERNRQMESHTNEMNSKISVLREKLEEMDNLSPRQKQQLKYQVSVEVAKLKDENNKKREELDEAYYKQGESINNDYTTNTEKIRTEASERYEAELDGIYGNSEFLEAPKSSSSSGKSSRQSTKTRTYDTKGKKTTNQLNREAAKKRSSGS